MQKRILLVLLIPILVILLTGCRSIFSASAEDTYSKTGKYQVTSEVIRVNEKDTYKIYYPAGLPEAFPIVVWGNGTGGTPEKVDSLLAHIASWGFVVIDNYVTMTGSGSEILDTAMYIINENSKADSIFYNKLNTDKVAAVGHSQGATGVINAAYRYKNSNVIKTIVATSLPADKWAAQKSQVVDLSKITVPVFFVKGDGPMEFWAVGTTLPGHYDALPAGTGAVMATCKDTDHNEVQKINGGKAGGYIVAWLRFQLMDDKNAKKAFAGNDPEIKSSKNWVDVAIKNIN